MRLRIGHRTLPALIGFNAEEIEARLKQSQAEQEAKAIKVSRKRALVSKIANLASITSIGFAAFVAAATIGYDLSSIYDVGGFDTPAQSVIREEALDRVVTRMDVIDSRLSLLEHALSEASGENIATSIATSNARQNSERIETLETLLDLQPRQVIEMTRLRDEIGDMRKEVASQQLQTVREVDRAYNLMLALVVALLVAVCAMAVSNFLRRNQEE